MIQELDDNQRTIFMRVLICKIHCPSFICFCKPSSHIYTHGPLKLENTPHLPTKTESDPQREASTQSSTDAIDAAQEGRISEQNSPEKKLRSSLRKPNSNPVASTEDRKKRVQWVDLLGKEIAQIKEFESSESEENENEEYNKRCVCTIL